MQCNIFIKNPYNLVRYTFGVFAAFVVLDLVLIATYAVTWESPDVIGIVIKGIIDSQLLKFYWSFQKETKNHRAIPWERVRFHSSLYTLLGIGVLIPFLGVMIVNLTPISSIYYGLMYLAKYFPETDQWIGYFIIYILPGVFFLTNLYLYQVSRKILNQMKAS